MLVFYSLLRTPRYGEAFGSEELSDGTVAKNGRLPLYILPFWFRATIYFRVCVCVCACVCVRSCVCVRACVFVKERQNRVLNLIIFNNSERVGVQ